MARRRKPRIAAVEPELVVETGLASNYLVVGPVVAKYSDHLPLYRQAAILERAGLDVGLATLDRWVI